MVKDDDYKTSKKNTINSLKYLGYIELDTIIWPTIKGNVDYEMIGDYYYMFGNVQLPKGNVEFRNKFYYPVCFFKKFLNTNYVLINFACI